MLGSLPHRKALPSTFPLRLGFVVEVTIYFQAFPIEKLDRVGFHFVWIRRRSDDLFLAMTSC